MLIFDQSVYFLLNMKYLRLQFMRDEVGANEMHSLFSCEFNILYEFDLALLIK